MLLRASRGWQGQKNPHLFLYIHHILAHSQPLLLSPSQSCKHSYSFSPTFIQNLLVPTNSTLLLYICLTHPFLETLELSGCYILPTPQLNVLCIRCQNYYKCMDYFYNAVCSHNRHKCFLSTFCILDVDFYSMSKFNLLMLVVELLWPLIMSSYSGSIVTIVSYKKKIDTTTDQTPHVFT